MRKAVSNSRAKRVRMTEAQGGLCFYCAQPMCERTNPGHDPWKPSDATIEHLLPRCMGGTNDDANMVAACRRCNQIMSMVETWCWKTFFASYKGRRTA